MSTINISQYPAAVDCVRHEFNLDETLATEPAIMQERVGGLLLFGAADAANDEEGMELAEVPLITDAETKEQRILYSRAGYKCGYAIGSNACARWVYDTQQHQIVPRGERPALTIE